MGKISPSDNIRIQTLHELDLGYIIIVSKFLLINVFSILL